ncbi:MAG: IS3 family transposase, partial [Pseudomonadota bacterium]
NFVSHFGRKMVLILGSIIKTELIYNERYATREIAKKSIFQYIEVYYNRVRRHSSLGSIAPEVFENQCKNVI